ncbi:hypothetical protein [Azospirillum sp. sgz301742]
MTDPKTTDPRETPPAEAPEDEQDRKRPDQIGIIPGKIPGHPTDPHDPRFPVNQPDLA